MSDLQQNIDKILDAGRKHPAVVSMEVKDAPPFVLSQVGSGEYVYFDSVATVEEGEVGIAFLVPVSMINEDSHTQLAYDDILTCDCTTIDGVCAYRPHSNLGKTTYLIRYPDAYLVRLQSEEPKLVIIPSEKLSELVEKMKQVEQVLDVRVEEVLDPLLKENMAEDNPLIFKAWIDIDDDKKFDHIVSFAAGESVYGSDVGHEWAIDNLNNLITLNNERHT